MVIHYMDNRGNSSAHEISLRNCWISLRFGGFLKGSLQDFGGFSKDLKDTLRDLPEDLGDFLEDFLKDLKDFLEDLP